MSFGKLRMNSMILAAATFMCAGAITGRADATAVCEPLMVTLDGMFVRGSASCEKAWLDRTASYIVVAEAQACGTMPKSELDALIKRGMLNFDKRVAENGLTTACQNLDNAMTLLEQRHLK